MLMLLTGGMTIVAGTEQSGSGETRVERGDGMEEERDLRKEKVRKRLL